MEYVKNQSGKYLEVSCHPKKSSPHVYWGSMLKVEVDDSFFSLGPATALPLIHVLMKLATSHKLSYHLTRRRRPLHVLYSEYAKVNPTGVESIDHLRPRCGSYGIG